MRSLVDKPAAILGILLGAVIVGRLVKLVVRRLGERRTCGVDLG